MTDCSYKQIMLKVVSIGVPKNDNEKKTKLKTKKIFSMADFVLNKINLTILSMGVQLYNSQKIHDQSQIMFSIWYN